MGIFNKNRIAGLETARQQRYFYGPHAHAKIVEQRDANIQNLKNTGGSANKLAGVLAVFADDVVVLGYERFLANLGGLQYSIECDDQDAKAFLESEIFSNWTALYQGLAISRVTGISGLEKTFRPGINNLIRIKDLLPFDLERIVYSLNDRGEYVLRITNFNNPFSGDEVEVTNFLIHRHYSVYIDNPYGLGIGGILAELVLCKRQLEALWQRIIEKYSEPIMDISIPDSASDEEIDEFFEALNSLKNGARFVLPEGFALNVHDISASGLSDLILPLIDRIDRAIMGLLVGESLTGKETSNGSNARDITARDIATQKALDFARELCKTITDQLIYQLLAYNFPGVEARLIVESPENLNELLDMYEKLERLGVKIDTDWLAAKAGVRVEAPKKTLGNNI